MAKERVPVNSFHRLMKPENVALITAMGKDKKTNIMPASWITPLSFKPPLVGVLVKPSRHTHSLIKESEEFVINFLTMDWAKVILECGMESGRDVDKFRTTSLTKEPSEQVTTPRIKEAYACIECKLNSSMKLGDHTLFVGEVVNVKAEQNALSETGILNLKEIKPTLYLGEGVFCSTSDFILKPKVRQ